MNSLVSSIKYLVKKKKKILSQTQDKKKGQIFPNCFYMSSRLLIPVPAKIQHGKKITGLRPISTCAKYYQSTSNLNFLVYQMHTFLRPNRVYFRITFGLTLEK